MKLLITFAAVVLRSDVSGKIMLKAYLTGMPECKFGMNDKLVLDREGRNRKYQFGILVRSFLLSFVFCRKHTSGIAIDDCTFHRCVRLGRFDTDRTISFVPPDGDFQLMGFVCPLSNIGIV